MTTGIQETTIDIVLHAQPLIVIVKYLPAIIASAIVASMIAIVIYMKKRLLQSLQSRVEEYTYNDVASLYSIPWLIKKLEMVFSIQNIKF